MKKIKKAIISVSDKKNLKFLLKILSKHKIKILSSGGTYREIKKLGFNCLEISDFTGSKEILDGRVKTLHPKIHSGILSIRNKKSHKNDLKINNYDEIDLVVVNFYPFENILKSTNNHKKIIENIDIGGPSLVRGAAKNYNDVTVLTNIDQYELFTSELIKNNGSTSLDFREKMSEEAFIQTSSYDAAISDYFIKKTKTEFPKIKILKANLIEKLRYGENSHQEASIYSFSDTIGLKQISGKKLSYNNYNDIFAALNLSKSLPSNLGAVIVKHANPCGVSINKNKTSSFKEALECDPISAFGGIVSCNFKINLNLAKELSKIFLEVVIGNGFEKDALNYLIKKKNLRLIDATNLNLESKINLVSNFNTALFQTPDNKIFESKNFKVVSKKKPSKKMLKELIFAFNVCRYVKSNAIVLTTDTKTVGIGSGQPSRLDSCKIAIEKMNKFQELKNDDKIIAASDAFFPFVDGIETLVQAGVSAVIQPSGSIRDKEIIKFADQTDTILVFSKTRHFRH